MSLIINDAKVKHLDEWNELQLKQMKARAQIWDALSVIMIMLALVAIVVTGAGTLWAVVTMLRWLV